MAKLRHLGTGATDQNSIHAEVRSRLNSRDACYGSLRNLLSFRLLSKNGRIKIYRTIIFPVILFGCETWSPTLREEQRLWMFENMVLRRMFGPKINELIGGWINLHDEEFHNLYL
jgi:hypothetical protein